MSKSAWWPTILLAGLMATTIPAPTRAVTFDRTTYLTFSRSVQIPGAMLPAGTYEFRLANPDTSRDMFQVLSRDGHTSYAIFNTFADRRMVATDESTVTFKETAAGVPPMVKSLFYGGELSGYEFVYPKRTLTLNEIALQQERGKSEASPVAVVTQTTTETRPAAQAEAVTSQTETTTAPSESAAAETTVARAEPAPAAPEPAAATSEQRTTSNPRPVGTTGQLPRTATSLPLVGFGGLGALIVGLGATLFSKRLA
jgi:hypothetical protein